MMHQSQSSSSSSSCATSSGRVVKLLLLPVFSVIVAFYCLTHEYNVAADTFRKEDLQDTRQAAATEVLTVLPLNFFGDHFDLFFGEKPATSKKKKQKKKKKEEVVAEPFEEQITDGPTPSPSNQPTTPLPTPSPSNQPTPPPSTQPTLSPTLSPTHLPTFEPSPHPSLRSSLRPSFQSTVTPSSQPTTTASSTLLTSEAMANGTSFGLVEIVLVALAGVLLFSFVALGCHFRKKKRNSNSSPQDQDEVHNNDELSQEEEGNGVFSKFSWISSVQQSDDAGGSLDEVSAPTTKEEAKEGDGWYPSWVSSFLEEHNLQ